MGLEVIVRAVKRYWPIPVICAFSYMAGSSFTHIHNEWQRVNQTKYLTRNTLRKHVDYHAHIKGKHVTAHATGPEKEWVLYAHQEKGKHHVVHLDLHTKKEKVIATFDEGIEDLIISPDGKHAIINVEYDMHVTNFKETHKALPRHQTGSAIGWDTNDSFYFRPTNNMTVKKFDLKKNTSFPADYDPVTDALHFSLLWNLLGSLFAGWMFYRQRKKNKKGILENEQRKSPWYHWVPDTLSRHPDVAGASAMVAAAAPQIMSLAPIAHILTPKFSR